MTAVPDLMMHFFQDCATLRKKQRCDVIVASLGVKIMNEVQSNLEEDNASGFGGHRILRNNWGRDKALLANTG